MPDWHSSCADLACRQRCQRPGCVRPNEHLLVRTGAHVYDCTVTVTFDASPPPASEPPSRRAAALPYPAGPSSPHPAHGPAGFHSEQDQWDEPLTRAAALRYLAVHLERSLSYIAQRVIRNDFRPAPIAISMASRDLVCSRATWKRDVTMLERLGLIARERRPGRPKGGGKNAGSLYQVHWGRIPQAWPRKFKPAHANGSAQFENGSLREEIGSLLGQAVFEKGSSNGEIGAFSATENGLKMKRNRPNGRDDSAAPADVIKSGAADAAANKTGTVPTPQPPPPGGGAQPSRGDPVPSSVAEQVRQAHWYRRR
jgi:hypothetical protein